MQAILDQIVQSIPRLVGALAILVIGWLIALVASAVVRRALHRIALHDRLTRRIPGEESIKALDMEWWLARLVFYLIMLFVLVAFFEVLGLTRITEPFNQLLGQVFQYAPRLIGAGILLLIAWIVATLLKSLVSRVLSAARIEERVGSQAGLRETGRVPLAQTLGSTVYWLVFLLFLPAVLTALALEGLLRPVQGMIDKILNSLPNLLAAVLILVVGWLIARIVQRIVTNLLAAVGVDRLSEEVGVARALGKQRLSGLLGLIVYALILVPVLIAALDALAVEAITRPTSNMLNTILGALPAILAAALVLTIAYVIGRVVARLITELLASAGFNTLPARLGLGKEPSPGQRTPSEITGYLVLVAIMLLAASEAFHLLGGTLLAELLVNFTVAASRVLVGLIIFAIGLYLANLTAKILQSSGTGQAVLLALAARVAILVLAGAMALSQMGLASQIINLAFGLLLGTVAVAVALAFGLGARDIAARELEGWLGSARSKQP